MVGLPTINDERPKIIYKESRLKICPYCNRSYLDLIDDPSYKNNFQLDHFYSKSKYPIFAVSFYNLIPICGFCNNQKMTKDIGACPFYGSGDTVKFSYKILSSEYITNIDDIDIDVNSDDVEGFWTGYLRTLYHQHRDIAQEVLQKTYIYNRGYMDSLEKQFGLIFETKDFSRMIYGVDIDEKQYGGRPLSKFIKDIYNQANRL